MNPGTTATFSSSDLPVDVGADAIIIAANATPGVNVGRLALWAYDVDDRLADNTDCTLSMACRNCWSRSWILCG